jgi:hypothetical protein
MSSKLNCDFEPRELLPPAKYRAQEEKEFNGNKITQRAGSASTVVASAAKATERRLGGKMEIAAHT